MNDVMKKFSTNKLKTKHDFQKLVNDLFEPLIPYLKTQDALIDFHEGGASFDMKASSLEGVARPLWGIVPLVLGGGTFDYWSLIRQALVNGTDPQHANFWGETSDYDQRSVEMAAIAFLLMALPEEGWEPLKEKERLNLVNWLAKIQYVDMPQNNWLFFTVLVQEALKNIGQGHLVNQSVQDKYIKRIHSWYLGDGWYADGDIGTIDHYGGFAMHFYSLLYAKFAKKPNIELVNIFNKRADEFSTSFQYWFAETGESLVQGRSLTYRFATASYWGALATSGIKSMLLETIKGIWARQIRYWMDKPIYSSDGRLTRGYTFPNLMMCEVYNSPTSPYWAMKAFFPLLLDDDHQFWSIQEADMPQLEEVYPMPINNTIVQRVNGHSIVHYAAPIHPLFQKDKYNKFAYTTIGGMDINSLLYSEQMSFGDNIFAISFDSGKNWQMRQENKEVKIVGNKITIKWSSGSFNITTLIQVLDDGKCIRSHEFEIENNIWVVESGYAVGQWYKDTKINNILSVNESHTKQIIEIQGEQAISKMKSLDSYSKQVILSTRTHTDVCYPRTSVPSFLTKLSPGKHSLTTEYRIIPI